MGSTSSTPRQVTGTAHLEALIEDAATVYIAPEAASWDLNAERFAAAMTLYEMTTGRLPVWGDGRSDPAVVDVGRRAIRSQSAGRNGRSSVEP
jgi:hypothetical protein